MLTDKLWWMYLELDTKPPWGHIFSTIGVWKNDGEKCQNHDLVMSAQTSESKVSQKRFPTGQCFAVHLRHSSDELEVGFGTASKFSMAGWWFFALWKMMELKSFGVILPYDIPNMMGKISQMFQSPPTSYGILWSFPWWPDPWHAATAATAIVGQFLWHENGKGTSLNYLRSSPAGVSLADCGCPCTA